jgi:hypothetical protein
MGPAENSTPKTQGKREMHDLVRATFAALEAANLAEVVRELRDRVFRRDASELLETVVDGGVCHWNFKPMVELLLRHVQGLAANGRIPPHERRLEIAATLELAGF